VALSRGKNKTQIPNSVLNFYNNIDKDNKDINTMMNYVQRTARDMLFEVEPNTGIRVSNNSMRDGEGANDFVDRMEREEKFRNSGYKHINNPSLYVKYLLKTQGDLARYDLLEEDAYNNSMEDFAREKALGY